MNANFYLKRPGRMKSIYNLLALILVQLLIVLPNTIYAQKAGDIYFEVILDSLTTDEPYLIVYQNSFYDSGADMADNLIIKPVFVKGRSYYFKLDQKKEPHYFDLVLKNENFLSYAIKNAHYEPGDSIQIRLNKLPQPRAYEKEYSGRGSAKYSCLNELNVVRKPDTINNLAVFSSSGNYNQLNRITWKLAQQLQLIEKYRPEISVYSYNLLKADVVGLAGKDLFSTFNSQLLRSVSEKREEVVKNLSAAFGEAIKFNDASKVPADARYLSRHYSYFILSSIVANTLTSYNKINYDEVFKGIKKIEDQELRDKVAVIYFIRYWMDMGDNYANIYRDAAAMIKNKACIDKLKEFGHNLPGEKFYSFSLSDANGTEVKLSQLSGKIVLIDFWFTGCGFCEMYYKNHLSIVEEKFKDNPDIAFVTVSIDKDRQKWIESLKSGKYTSDKAINLYTNGQGTLHPLIQYHNVLAFPKPMLLGRDGRILDFSDQTMRKKDALIIAIDSLLKK